MGFFSTEQRTWGACRRCGATTRHVRMRAVRPARRLRPLEWLRFKLFDAANPWTCMECPNRIRAEALRSLKGFDRPFLAPLDTAPGAPSHDR